jgi:hypothetical protein
LAAYCLPPHAVYMISANAAGSIFIIQSAHLTTALQGLFRCVQDKADESPSVRYISCVYHTLFQRPYTHGYQGLNFSSRDRQPYARGHIYAIGRVLAVAVGGLVLIVLAIGPTFRGFGPARGQWIFEEGKNP